MSDHRGINGYDPDGNPYGPDQVTMPDSEAFDRFLPDPRMMQRRAIVRRALIGCGIVAGVAIGGYALWSYVGPEAIVDFLKQLWPVLVAPPVGWFLGKMVARDLYRPDGRILVNLDTDNNVFRATFVPEELFKYIDQRGNNVVYHTPRGVPVYLTETLDLQNGRVRYGWVHEDDALVVMSRITAYNRWYWTLGKTLSENLQLMHNPEVIGMGYARSTLRRHLDDIAKAVGLDNSSDVDGQRDRPSPESYDGEVGSDGSFNTGPEADPDNGGGRRD